MNISFCIKRENVVHFPLISQHNILEAEKESPIRDDISDTIVMAESPWQLGIF